MKKYIFAFITILYSSMHAQSIHTGYHSNAFILKSASNPAAIPKSNSVFGVSGLSNISVGVQSPLSLNEVFQKGQDDSLRVHFPSIVSGLDDHDAFNFGGRANLLNLGFRVGYDKNVFIYFGDEVVVDVNAKISSDVFEYLTKGNAAFLDRQMNFDKERIDAISYNSLYLGSAFQVSDELSLGLRLKYLSGISSIHTEKLLLGFHTDSEFYQTTLTADLLIKSSGLEDLDAIEFDPTLNNGFALDVGAIYQLTDELELSFALTDVGSINWAAENNEYHTTDGEKTFLFEGLTQSSGQVEDLEKQMEDIADSLANTMEVNAINDVSYTTNLNSNLIVSGKYQFADKHGFSLLFHSKKLPESRINTYAAGYQFQLAKSFEILASYKNFNGISNIGGGFVWSPGPFQWHMLAENLVLDVFDLKNVALHFGLSLNFGRDR